MRDRRRKIMAALIVAMAAGGVFYIWSIQREIPFDPERWREPRWSWDRWRMLEDLKDELATWKPTRDQVLQVLEGVPEQRDPYRDMALSTLQKSGQVVYHLPKPFPSWRLINLGGGELRLYFSPNDRFHSSAIERE